MSLGDVEEADEDVGCREEAEKGVVRVGVVGEDEPAAAAAARLRLIFAAGLLILSA